jgi:hypothetical protein
LVTGWLGITNIDGPIESAHTLQEYFKS